MDAHLYALLDVIMKTTSKHYRSPFPVLLLLSLFSCSSSHGLSACDGCVPDHLLRSEAYGIDIAPDYLAIAVQHVNGTLEPVAMTISGPQYRSLMSRYLMESDIYPYGYGNELPEHIPHRLEEQLDDTDVNVLFKEITKIVALVQSQDRKIGHYSVAIPTFFTRSNEEHLLEAFRRSDLPEAPSSEPADFAAFTALNTTRCLRHFEFNCAAIDYNPRTIIFLEYSNFSLSGMLYHFWSGWYFDRVAYFADARLGNRTCGDQGHWRRITHKIQALVEDNKDKIPFGRDPLEVVLLGLLGSDPSFHQAVRDALGFVTNEHVRHPTAQESTFLDPIFASALGAARGAKSNIDRPRPMGCNVEDSECTIVREKVLNDSLVKQSPREAHSWEL